MILDDLSEDNYGTSVTLPDKSTITSIKKGKLPINGLSNNARKTKVFDNLNQSLLSLGQLCDDNCKVVQTKKNYVHIKIIKKF